MTSRTLPSSSGSVENLNVSRRQGCTPYARHARATVAFPSPSCLPSSREDQCVTAKDFGGGSNVAAMIAASSMVLGRQLLVKADQPAREKPIAPFDHRRARDPDQPRRGRRARTVGDREHDPRPFAMPGRDRLTARPVLKRRAILLAERQLG